jgi:hypothetical protein
MQKVPKGIKIGLLFGLGLVVLINIAVFFAIFRQPECRVMERSCVKKKEEKLVGPGAIRGAVVRGLDFLMGTASGH